MDVFVTRCLMLPPPDPYSERPYQTRTVITTKGCCTRTEQETIVVMVPSNTMQRTQHQLRNRERVIHEHDVTMMTEKLQEEPRLEELERDDSKLRESKLTPKDIIIGCVTFVSCLLVLLLLCLHHFPVDVSVRMESHS